MPDKLQIKTLEKHDVQYMIINEEFEYLDFSLEDYRDMFDELKNKKQIFDCNYQDKQWHIVDDKLDKSINIDFTISRFEEELKAFVLVLLSRANLSNRYVKNMIYQITKMYDETKEFNNDYIDSYIEKENLNHVNGNGITKFLMFIQLENSNNIITKLNNLKMPTSAPRTLPMFYSILVFDYLVNDYFVDKDVKNQFYPIYLWWKLSSILPLRPTEFISLKRNCLSKKNQGEKITYYIKIERAKERHMLMAKKNLPLIDKFSIPYEIWKNFENYINMANQIDSNIYVFSKQVFDEIVNIHQKRRERDYLGESRFVQELDWFCKTLTEIYGIEFVKKGTLLETDKNKIEKFSLGDTRHIAICDLMLQGVNPIKVAQIAGHKSVETQMSYCSHYSDYINSKTKVLQDIISGNIKLKNNQITICNDKKTSILQKELLGNSFYSLPKVDGGRCTSKCFPNECPLDGCYLCPKLIPDNSMDIDKLKQIEDNLNKEIETKLEYLKSIVSTSVFNNIQEIQSKELELGSIFNQKMWIESYRYLKESNKLEDNSRMITGGSDNE